MTTALPTHGSGRTVSRSLTYEEAARTGVVSGAPAILDPDFVGS